MIETLIALVVKVAAVAIVAEVKKEAIVRPIAAAAGVFAGWDKDGKLQTDKWVSIAAGAVDIESAVEDALDLGKSEGVERVWNTLQVATALVSTGKDLLNVMNEPDPMKTLRDNASVQATRIPLTKFPTFYQERRVQIPWEPVHKPPVKRHKKVARKIQRQIQPGISVIRVTRNKKQP